MKEAIASIAGVVVVALILASLLGWLVAAIWNHFPVLETAHHMTWWDGFLTHLLCGLLFKSNNSSSSS